MANEPRDWVTTVSVLLKITLVVCVVYVAGVFLERHWREPLGPEEQEPVRFHEDLYVHPVRTHISSFKTAQSKLPGMDLWVREGWRWELEPSGRQLEPLEKVTPKRVFRRDGEVWIELEQGGSLPVTMGGRFVVDDIFFSQNPRELYDHWSDEEWAMVERHEVEEGMSETQVGFALGFGRVISSSGGSPPARVVEYTAGEEAGVEPMRVRFRDYQAVEIEPIEDESGGES